MQKKIEQQIEKIKNEGFDLDFSTVLNYAIENYKKIAIYAGLVLLVFSLILVFVFSTLIVFLFGVENLIPEAIKDLTTTKITGYNLFYYIIFQIVFSLLVAPFSAGLYKMADSAQKDEKFDVSDMFHYYKSPFIGPIISFTLLISLLTILFQTLSEHVLNFPFLGLLFSLFISIATSLSLPLILFANFDAINAIKSSYTIISKQSTTIIGLIVIGWLISALGLIGCCIGIIFTVAFNISMNYAIYRNIFMEDDSTEIDTIGTN